MEEGGDGNYIELTCLPCLDYFLSYPILDTIISILLFLYGFHGVVEIFIRILFGNTVNICLTVKSKYLER